MEVHLEGQARTLLRSSGFEPIQNPFSMVQNYQNCKQNCLSSLGKHLDQNPKLAFGLVRFRFRPKFRTKLSHHALWHNYCEHQGRTVTGDCHWTSKGHPVITENDLLVLPPMPKEVFDELTTLFNGSNHLTKLEMSDEEAKHCKLLGYNIGQIMYWIHQCNMDMWWII